MAPVLQNLRYAGQPRHALQPNINRPVRFLGLDDSAFKSNRLPPNAPPILVGPDSQRLLQDCLQHKLDQPAIDLSGMNTSVATVLQKLLPRCEYGMDIEGAFAAHPKPFDVDLSDYPKAMLNGFDSPVMRQGFVENTEKPVKGLCHELSFAVAKKLEALPNQPYRLEMARVYSPQYFHRFSGMNHWAVLISHPNKPEKQWLVDPSFGYAKPLLQATLDGYEILDSHTLLHYETRRALEGHPMMLRRHAISLMPLGFVKSVFDLSGVKKQAGLQTHWEKAMAYLGFVPQGETSAPEMAVKLLGQENGAEIIEPSLNLEAVLKPAPPLQCLLDHLKSQFRS
jgi:hypothetical protein